MMYCVYQVNYFFTFKEKKGIRGRRGIGGLGLGFQGRGGGVYGDIGVSVHIGI